MIQVQICYDYGCGYAFGVNREVPNFEALEELWEYECLDFRRVQSRRVQVRYFDGSKWVWYP